MSSKKKSSKTTTREKVGAKSRKGKATAATPVTPPAESPETEAAVVQSATEQPPEAPTPVAEQASTEKPTAETPRNAVPAQAASQTETDTPPPAPKARARKPKEPREKKASAIDSAALVLAEEGRPMNCKELIETMAAKGYWTSPNGQTPSATLYSAILRDIGKKGSEARFKKVERGQFVRTEAP
jgi:hypothetical protein